jgi:hypothetical protein
MNWLILPPLSFIGRLAFFGFWFFVGRLIPIEAAEVKSCAAFTRKHGTRSVCMQDVVKTDAVCGSVLCWLLRSADLQWLGTTSPHLSSTWFTTITLMLKPFFSKRDGWLCYCFFLLLWYCLFPEISDDLFFFPMIIVLFVSWDIGWLYYCFFPAYFLIEIRPQVSF